MMDCWNSGIRGIKIGKSRFFVFLLIPSFQYSIIPIFRLGCSRRRKALAFLYGLNVTKILPIKGRKLPSKVDL
jgi:hypothetical protein